ncbi:hypothetical protein GGH12_000561 [Coemansia sp. RSA 1822]|nr:hypothetical protein LPJ76_000845 [Coemansia sp. RSA 638]KAJ2123502.1 hypothetical protein IW147_002560 [Coemansia sp. RSA 720]KAJ2545183.1 hypothetical protein GGF49_000616 [Coemansia sp. RSA 1853]KAJ2567005.1 hypothetical protein GGH12_000561 [Coemansia sp. RSA 1822]
MVGVSASPHFTSETAQPRRRQAPFIDRVQAGHQLARNLSEYTGCDDVVVVSVSRGGAVVGSVVASMLGAHTPHMYYKVQAIPCPRMPGLSLGSVAGDGSVRIDTMVAESMNISAADPQLMDQVSRIDKRLRRDQRAFRRPLAPREMHGRVVIVVDDVVEAGDTMREAVMHLRHCFSPRRVVAAAPVCLADLRKQLQRHVDAVVDIVSPLYVGSVSQWYAAGDAVVPSEQLLLERMFARTNGRFDNS